MRTIVARDAKKNFSGLLNQVKGGEQFRILHDTLGEPVAMLVPIETGARQRTIGMLDGKASFTVNGTGKITEKEFLGL